MLIVLAFVATFAAGMIAGALAAVYLIAVGRLVVTRNGKVL